MYNTNQVSGVNESTPIEPSKDFHKVKLESVEVTKNENGTETYLDFNFREVGTERIVRDRIFEPKDQSATPPYSGYNFETEVKRTVNHVKHIMMGYMSEQEAVVDADNWEAFANGVKAKFPQGFNSVEVTLKVVYNKTGYIKVPASPNFLSAPGREPKGGLSVSSYDIYDKPAQSNSGGSDAPADFDPNSSASTEI